jgi:hypothetical protein
MLHLTIGRLLRGRAPRSDLEPRRLFDIVHSPRPRPAARSASGRAPRRRRCSNLDAGRRAEVVDRARRSARAVRGQLHALLASAQRRAVALAFEVGLELAESRYLCGQFEPPKR